MGDISKGQGIACSCVYIENATAFTRRIGSALCPHSVRPAEAAIQQRKGALILFEAAIMSSFIMSIKPLKLTARDGAYIDTARFTDAGRPAVLPSHDRWHALPSVHQRASPQSPALDGETRQHDACGTCRELPRYPHYLSCCSPYCLLAFMPPSATSLAYSCSSQAPHASHAPCSLPPPSITRNLPCLCLVTTPFDGARGLGGLGGACASKHIMTMRW